LPRSHWPRAADLEIGGTNAAFLKTVMHPLWLSLTDLSLAAADKHALRSLKQNEKSLMLMIPTCGPHQTIRNLLAAIFIAAAFQTHAQGVVYDQQSTVSPSSLGDFLVIQTEPLTQSFIPTLSAIGFVQFDFSEMPNNGNNGATVYVNLWTGSPNTRSATLLGSTAPVYMPDGFGWGFPGVRVCDG